MCYACTQCGKCGKFGEGENLASMISIPCLKCGAVVNPFNGICTECGHQAFVTAGAPSVGAGAPSVGAGAPSPSAAAPSVGAAVPSARRDDARRARAS